MTTKMDLVQAASVYPLPVGTKIEVQRRGGLAGHITGMSEYQDQPVYNYTDSLNVARWCYVHEVYSAEVPEPYNELEIRLGPIVHRTHNTTYYRETQESVGRRFIAELAAQGYKIVPS